MLRRHRLVAPTFQLDPAREALRRNAWSSKELHFFDDERRDWEHPDYTYYCGTRTSPDQVCALDSTPSYIMWPGALERMHRFNPGMRLIASFRDPIERAFSQWAMSREQKNSYPEFSEAIDAFDDVTLLDRIPKKRGRWSVHRKSMVLRGRYGAQLERGLAQFDRSQWLMLNFTDWVTDYQACLDQITDFVGLHRFRRYPDLRTYPTPGGLQGTPPSEDDVNRLVERYADDLALFEKLSGLDVSQWPTRRIVQGEMTAGELAERLARKFVDA